jgi:hypothetical protein
MKFAGADRMSDANAGGLARPGVRASKQLRRYPMESEDAVE